jgi:hypothetical protein
MPAAGLSPEQAAKAAQLRLLLAQMMAPQMPPAQIEPGAPLPPSGGFADTVSRDQPMPNAGASNMSIQPGKKR